MKKYISSVLCILLLSALLAGCSCSHSWKDANCEIPKTCTQCGRTEGAPLGHVWQAATCENAKTCEVCGKTDGEAKGHQWVDVTCEEAQHCTVCHQVMGEPLGHVWADATTEAPKTCRVCMATEGDRIITDPRFTTEACKALFGTWKGEYVIDGRQELELLELELPDEENLEYTAYMTYTFCNDGTFQIHISFEAESYFRVVRLVSIEMLYDQYAQQGMNREQADAYHFNMTGMNVAAAVDAQIAGANIRDYDQALEMVYYVQGSKIYAALTWDDEMEPEEYTLRDGKLYMVEDDMEMEKQAD